METFVGIIMAAKKINYLMNQVIYKEDEASKYFYFIKSGEIELVKYVEDNDVKDKTHIHDASVSDELQ